MWIRQACAAMLFVSLCACRVTKIDDPRLISGAGAVRVLQSSYVASGDSGAVLGAGSITYVISDIELTNDQNATLYPVISHVYLTDHSGNRFFGVDRGSVALAGISNDLGPIAPGGKRALTVGFRADATTIGTIRYEY